ncbi:MULTISPECIES: hypothetical protein [unclassified Streptomyces]|uniref:hypothetical protein n=1 Tax=unclassified Streptomyces TaxID=2593676 RepID=UPI0035D8BA0A
MPPHEPWTALPEEAREHVDAFVVRLSEIRAAQEIREPGVALRPAPARLGPAGPYLALTWPSPARPVRLCRPRRRTHGEARAGRLAVPPRGPGDDGPPCVRAE